MLDPLSRSNGDGGGENLLVVSVAENRSREVCLAIMSTENASTLRLQIFQDVQSYSQTIEYLRCLAPHEILLRDGTRGKPLSLKIVELFGLNDAKLGGIMCRVLFINRQYFDQDRGAEMLQKIILSGINSDVLASYVSLATSCCLLRYIENVCGSSFAPKSLQLVIRRGYDGHMSIDNHTASALELVKGVRTGSYHCSLFGVMNKTKTSAGSRLLRSNILNPCQDAATINERSNLVSFFLLNEDCHMEISELLESLPDLDKMLAGLVFIPRSIDCEIAYKEITTLICLRHSLKSVRILAQTLQAVMDASAHNGGMTPPIPDTEREHAPLKFELLSAIINNLSVPSLEAIEHEIGEFLHDAVSHSRSTATMRNQACFAVRANIDGMLDVARKTYLQCVEDIYERASAYGELFPHAVPKVSFSVTRGYYLQLPQVKNVPHIYVQLVKNAKSISCTTDEVASLSDRAREAEQQALLLTHEVIQGLMSRVRERMESLFAAVESLALLDMVFSFSQLVTTSPLPHCKPRLSSCGSLFIRNGYHPIVASQPDVVFSPTDTVLTPTQNVLILSGEHGSGKSTELKKVACICIMAQIGCYVPAESAIIPLRDRLLTRIITADDAENNISSFLLEMRETDCILRSVTPCSLVIIDELGRSTGNAEGQAIALSVVEALRSFPAYSLIATHHERLCDLQGLYPNVFNAHIHAKGHSRTVFSGPLPSLEDPYGIRMAKECGIPLEMIVEAEKIRDELLRSSQGRTLSHRPRGGDTPRLTHGRNRERTWELTSETEILQLLLMLRESRICFAAGLGDIQARMPEGGLHPRHT